MLLIIFFIFNFTHFRLIMMHFTMTALRTVLVQHDTMSPTTREKGRWLLCNYLKKKGRWHLCCCLKKGKNKIALVLLFKKEKEGVTVAVA